MYEDEFIQQFESKEEMMELLGIDPETIEGDYAEAYLHMQKIYNNVNIDVKFDLK